MNMAVATYNPQILVDTNGLTEKEWLEWRRKGVGGSDASIILGICCSIIHKEKGKLFRTTSPFPSDACICCCPVFLMYL